MLRPARVVRDASQIESLLDWAWESAGLPTQFPARTYEDGVLQTLMYLIGDKSIPPSRTTEREL